MIEVVSGISAIAAVFSAVAAFFAWRVADKTFKFNKSLVLNKSDMQVLYQLIESLKKLRYVRKLNPLEVQDEEFLDTEKLLDDIKKQIDSIRNSNKEVETTVQSWSNKPEGKILVLLESNNSWEKIQSSEPEVLDNILDYFKGVEKNLLK